MMDKARICVKSDCHFFLYEIIESVCMFAYFHYLKNKNVNDFLFYGVTSFTKECKPLRTRRNA